MYKVIVADDHSIVREGIKKVIEQSDRFEVSGEAVNGEQLIASLDSGDYDLAVVDISMPGMDGIETLRIIRKKHPDIKVVMLTMHSEQFFFESAVKAGADGYIVKNDSSGVIRSVIRDVMEGRKSFSSHMQTVLAKKYVYEDHLIDQLTRRERQVLALAAAGRAHRDISEELGISISTVEFHKKNLKSKLNAKTVVDLVNIARKYNLA
jgi:DNA-binding NarL/FixJ family response regulator